MTPPDTAGAITPRQRSLVLGLWLAVLLLSVVQILRTPFTADLSAFLPGNPDAQQRVLIEQLQSGVPARTLLMGIDGDQPLKVVGSLVAR